MSDDSKRSIRLNIRLSKEMSDQLTDLSDRLGVPSSTLAAIAVGQFVTKSAMELEMVEAVKKTVEMKLPEIMAFSFNQLVESEALMSASRIGSSETIEGLREE